MSAPRPTGTAPGAASNVAEMRRLLMRMMVAVVLLHAAAIAVFLLADMESAGRSARTTYVAVWAVATFAVVMPFLRRIRMARRGGPRPR